jgi:hypothetical protein
MRRTRSTCCARTASGHARRAADERDELTPLHLRRHSITSSASASNVGGTSTASAVAVTLTKNYSGASAAVPVARRDSHP